MNLTQKMFWVTGLSFKKKNSFDQCDFPNNGANKIDEESVHNLVKYVTVQEVKTNYFPVKTSPGHDGLTMKELRRLNPSVLAKLYTLWSRLYWIPMYYLDSKTIFIPMCDKTNTPADLRPVSIQPVLEIQYHKILNKSFINS